MRDHTADQDELERIWTTAPGLGRLAAVNHHVIGLRFILTALAFFAIGGLLAMLLRIQLATLDAAFLPPGRYAQVFTVHGTVMMFLFVIPLLEGLAMVLLPKMLGARDLAFPRLSAFGYWCYLFGGLILLTAMGTGLASDAGRFLYPQLSSSAFSPGIGLDLWLLGIPFFDPARGGDPLLWQHLFWSFGHPEVYVMFLPAAAVISTIVPAFARRPIAGYRWVVGAILSVAGLSFLLWGHHMFTAGLHHGSVALFSAASLLVAIPTGVQLFAWIATLARAKGARRKGDRLPLPMLWVLGFFFTFTAGGLTGVMLAVIPFDLQAHDTPFVVAQIHLVLLGGFVFPMIAALYHWFPLVTGRKPEGWLGRTAFWLTFTGMNATFGAMHLTGLLGMARRVATYALDAGWTLLNLASSAGSVTTLSLIGAVVTADKALRRGRKAMIDILGAFTWNIAVLLTPIAMMQTIIAATTHAAPATHVALYLWLSMHGGIGTILGAIAIARRLQGRISDARRSDMRLLRAWNRWQAVTGIVALTFPHLSHAIAG